MAIVVDPCLAGFDAKEKNLPESISALKLAITFLTRYHSDVGDPCLAEFEAKEKSLLESISAWRFAITVLGKYHGDCRGFVLSRI